MRSGRCLCGGIRFELAEPLRDVVNCHCSQCRQFHGHFAPYTAVNRDQLNFVQSETLKWFESTENAVRRGFCGECGSSLFWDKYQSPTISVVAGSLSPPTGLKTIRHIFVDDVGDYYAIEDSLEKLPGTMS